MAVQVTAIVQRQKLSEQINKLRETAKVDLNEEVVKVTPKTDAPADPKAEAAAKKDEKK